MFDFLKKKLSNVVNSVVKRISKPVEKPQKEKAKRLEKKPEKIQKQKEAKEKMTFAQKLIKKVTEKEITEDELVNIFDEMEMNLLEADVAVEVIDKLKEDLKRLGVSV